MTHENSHPEEYKAPALADPEKPGWDLANQLHGEDYDLGHQEVSRLSMLSNQLVNKANELADSISVSQGSEPATWGKDTPEGLAIYQNEHRVLEPDQVQQAWNEHAVLMQDIGNTQKSRADIAARLWQEEGTRLFQDWQAGKLDPRTALETYYSVWNTYSPEEFYKECGVDRETVRQLYIDALTKYGESSRQARSLPDNLVEGSFIRMASHPAQELGISVSEFVV